jgi:hypothetical protein
MVSPRIASLAKGVEAHYEAAAREDQPPRTQKRELA